jgi:hypothetical protein
MARLTGCHYIAIRINNNRGNRAAACGANRAKGKKGIRIRGEIRNCEKQVFLILEHKE